MPDSEQIARLQVAEVRHASDVFTPAGYFPVRIDFADRENPYELADQVVYDNGIVRVEMEPGFKWDGVSVPIWLPVVPWVLTLVAMHFLGALWLWIVTAILVAYTIRLLPYMQKMGLHYRAGGVHDKLYRAQKIARVVADAIFVSILETDGVPWDVRWLMYRRVRHWGWIAWNRNAKALRAKAEAAKDVEVQSQ